MQIREIGIGKNKLLRAGSVKIQFRLNGRTHISTECIGNTETIDVVVELKIQMSRIHRHRIDRSLHTGQFPVSDKHRRSTCRIGFIGHQLKTWQQEEIKKTISQHFTHIISGYSSLIGRTYCVWRTEYFDIS